ncbi:hypothetical protein I3J09_13940 [Streptomyces clavuligerus]|uniref:Lipoprotein n=1 Tax=Streptomyces clavuligerus TaxID=1901 RepID=E2PWM9_STRCL|nr:hypothetical protein BB341_13790 [Streptomyces clavuligerus]AXU13812.1 hypothetical protein D1794_14370 [Streptomyces clavuligerus]EFG08028.1 Hypothetical protein SCLAV_2957 [Streptomyces clavuligerus]MBY6303779.1 hypothetical protein [Streptomyces clavuligerus]QCS06587.1 hypothetical protein CRV15_13720 [Streptomyces clavuligerus]
MNGPRCVALRRSLASVAVLTSSVAMVMVTGCARDDDRTGNGTTAGAPRDPDRGTWPAAQAADGLAKGLALPLQSYLIGYAQQVTVLRAQQALQSACMAKFGFTYEPPEPGLHPPPSADDANMPRRYGVADLEQVRRHGYHLPDNSGEPPAYSMESEAAEAALMGRTKTGEKPTTAGIPEGGCLGESERRIGRVDGALASRLNNQGFDSSQADPAVREVVGKWSACMRQKGYTVSTPLDAAELPGSLNAPSPTPREIAVAVADVECKQSTDLVAVWFAAETAIQNELIEKNQLALQEAKQTTEAAVRNAARTDS